MFSIPIAQTQRDIDLIEIDLARFTGTQREAYQGACYLLGTEVVTRAMRRTPVDTGYLRASRYVTKPTFFGADRFELEVGFSAPYAVFVHEKDKNYTVGEFKFLRKAFDEVAPNAERFLVRQIERLVAAGQGIDDVPEVHPTGPLIGPHIHPRLRTRRRKAEAAQARADRRRQPRQPSSSR
jgi:hypothetical protein